MQTALHVKVPKVLSPTVDKVLEILEDSLQISQVEQTVGRYALSNVSRFTTFAVTTDSNIPHDEARCPICGATTCTWASTYVTARLLLEVCRTCRIYLLRDLPQSVIDALDELIGKTWIVKARITERALKLHVRDVYLLFTLSKLPGAHVRTWLPCTLHAVDIGDDTIHMFLILDMFSEWQLVSLTKLLNKPILEIVDTDGENYVLAPRSVEAYERLGKVREVSKACRVVTNLPTFRTWITIRLDRVRAPQWRNVKSTTMKLVKIYDTTYRRLVNGLALVLNPDEKVRELFSSTSRILVLV